jgi:hypothetical protein
VARASHALSWTGLMFRPSKKMDIWIRFGRIGLTQFLLGIVPSFLYVRMINLYIKKDCVTPNKDGANLIYFRFIIFYYVI